MKITWSHNPLLLYSFTSLYSFALLYSRRWNGKRSDLYPCSGDTQKNICGFTEMYVVKICCVSEAFTSKEATIRFTNGHIQISQSRKYVEILIPEQFKNKMENWRINKKSSSYQSCICLLLEGWLQSYCSSSSGSTKICCCCRFWWWGMIFDIR